MIKIRGLTKYYKVRKKKIKALENFDLDVAREEIVAVLGPNGAGKSTLLKLLATLLYPDWGNARIAGYDLRRQPAKIRPLIGAVFGPQMIYHRLTGRANLKFFGTIYRVPNLGRRIEELVALVGLEDKIDDLVEGYSAGMKSKLALIRGLIQDPEVLFLDEPTVGLDPNISLKIRAEIKRLRERGKAIILATHYMVEAEQLADRIAILNKGRLVSLDTPLGIRRKIPSRHYLEVSFVKPLTDIETLKHDFIIPHGQTRAMLPIKKRENLNQLIARVLAFNLPIKNIQVIEPSLEEAFSYLTESQKKKNA